MNCGDGTNTAPTISSLNINETEYTVGDGGGAIDDNFSFKFFDAEGNIVLTYIHDLDTDEVTKINADVFGLESGTWLGKFIIDTSASGTDRLEIYMKDENGLESNHLQVDITINPVK